MGHYDGCRDGYCGCGQSLDDNGVCLMGGRCDILNRKVRKDMTNKKVTNKDYEATNTSVVELPSGDNVRLTYNRGISLNYGEVKADVAYSADFPADEVDTAFGKVKAWVDAKLKEAIKNKI